LVNNANISIHVHSSAPLVLIPPPLPEEPGNGVVVRVVGPDGLSFVAERDDEAAGGDELARWFSSAKVVSAPWVEIAKNAKSITRLVPDPCAEPVELPLVYVDRDGDEIRVDKSQRRESAAFICTDDGGMYVNAEQARTIARALWTAADRAEARDTGGES
jgi:hypothetical protein